MSSPASRFIDADQVSEQKAKRAYIVAEICRRCQDAEHGLLFSACQFEDGECPLETIGKILAKGRQWDDRYSDLRFVDRGG